MSAAAEPASPDALERMRAEQVQLLFANGGVPILVTLTVACTLAGLLVYSGTLGLMTALVWAAAMAAQTSIRLAIRTAYQWANPPASAWRTWARRFGYGQLAAAGAWGFGCLFLLPPGRVDLQMLVLTVLMAAIYGAQASSSAYVPAFLAFFPLAFLPTVAWMAAQGDVLHWAVAGLLLLWAPVVVALARRYNASLVQALQLRFENAALVEDLRAQKTIAEQASRAKSRFLASASHDLRQPVHALGMFVGALRAHKLPKRSVQLIDHIDLSIGALDGLFTSLLDISRLDAGVTETKPFAMPLQPLLARVCRDLEGEARAKGLTLTVVPTDLAIHSDPVLLERILRNIVANAVRYTEGGRVLVGCRRRGERVSLEVWDTGPGIEPEQRDAIFEEFYQVSNPDRDRAKGLGLGLAIVRRLSVLLDHPLSVESWPGRGSVFRVSAPRADRAEVEAAPGETALTGLRTGLIVAIDDEAAVRTAMTELLESWGHRVIAAGGAEEALAALAECPSRPDLIICDYRLRDGENGIEVIRQLQAEYNDDIPALLLTGDTAPERIREAQSSGYPLLHKPLAHARLRAAVGNLISGAAAPPADEPVTAE